MDWFRCWQSHTIAVNQAIGLRVFEWLIDPTDSVIADVTQIEH